MGFDSKLWQFIQERLTHDHHVVLLIVAQSSGSSPGRPGYKMAVGADGELCGSIGGGVMEVRLVEQARSLLAEPGAAATGSHQPQLIEQVHRKNAPQASGMICSGRQIVILKVLTPGNAVNVEAILEILASGDRPLMIVTEEIFAAGQPICPADEDPQFERSSKREFTYSELLGPQNELFIIGGGHCSLALSELMSRLHFRITIFDDRPDLNTIEKNRFADDIRMIESYENIGDLVTEGQDVYVVVMTLGYASDEIAIRQLVKKEIKYLGVLGSKAKMGVLLKSLEKEGVDPALLSRIRTPIGLPINSHSPEEIAVSIAAEIISIKNS